MEIEIAQHTELKRTVNLPCWFRFGDCDCVNVVQHDLHCQQANQEPDCIADGSPIANAQTPRAVSTLGYVRIEGQDWAGKKKWRIEGVGKVIAERIVPRGSGDAYTIPL